MIRSLLMYWRIMTKYTKSLPWAFLALIVFLGAPMYAQIADANVVGTVTDQTGAAVPEARVELENLDTGISANRDGRRIGQLSFR